MRWRGTLFTKRWLLWFFVFAVVLAFVANEVGWVTAEVGRQPWIVYPTMANGVLSGGLRTSDAVSEAVTAEHVLGSIIMFGVVYFLLFILWIMLLNKKIQQGPEPVTSWCAPESAEAAIEAAVSAARPSRLAHGTKNAQTRERLMDLNILWFILLGVLLAGYAILDGFDLGVGMLQPVAKTDEERRIVLNSIGPIWDGNEVWLVTFGGAMFAAFPEAYATVFSGFYIAFMLVLFALILRAVSIEFRSKIQSRVWRRFWDFGFFASSLLASLLFGSCRRRGDERHPAQ